VSSSTNSLVFSGIQAAGAAVVSNNDSGTFVISGLTITGTGPGSGTQPTYTISGNPLDFTVAGGTSTLLVNNAGTVRPLVNINTNLIIDASQLTVSGNNSNNNLFTLGGVVSGTGMLALRNGGGTGGTYYTTVQAGTSGGLSPTNSFSGGFWFQQGTLNTGASPISDVVGMSGQNSMFGSAGSVILGSGTSFGSIRFNSPATSGSTNRTTMVGGTAGATITIAPTATVTFGMGAITSGTGGERSMTLATSGANTANFDVGGLVSNGSDGSVLSLRFNGSGSGTLYLRNAANSFSGGVSLSGNTSGKTYVVSVAKIGNTGSASPLGTSGTINLGGATAGTNMLTWTGTAAETTDKVISLASTNANNVAAINNTGSGLLKFTSDVVASGASAKNFNFFGTGTTEFAGRIVDNGAFTTGIRKGDAGFLILSGSNTFTGLTDINNGTLQFAINSLNNTSGIRWSSSTGVLQWGTGNTQDISPKIQMTAGNWSIVDTNGNNVTFATSIGGTASANFNKRGLGTLTLSASNSWTGSTAVDAGGLVLNGSLAVGSNLSVAAAAWLAGTGTVPGTVTTSGTLSPGSGGSGVISLGSLVLTSTSVTAIDVASAGTRGTNYDGVSILNASGLTYGGTMSFAFGASVIAPNTTLDIFSFTGTPSGGFATLVSTGFYAGTWTNNNNGTFTLIKDSDTLTFSESTGDVIVVPEPAVTLVGMAGLVGALAVRRRRLTRAGTSDAA
jgi:autotransporter-associated beta strand protein